MMKDTTVSNDTCNMTVRLYDGKQADYQMYIEEDGRG